MKWRFMVTYACLLLTRMRTGMDTIYFSVNRLIVNNRAFIHDCMECSFPLTR
jgi:hypothetical protein